MNTKKHFDPFTNLILDDYEREVEESFARGGFVSASKKELEETKKMFQEAAKRYKKLRESKSITIRVNREKLIKIKARAKRSGIPYQRIINALIGQYADDKINLNI